MSDGGWFDGIGDWAGRQDWLPGFLGGAGLSGSAPAEQFGPKPPAPAPDPLGIMGMVPGGGQDLSGVSRTSAAAGDATKPTDRFERYRRALLAGQQAVESQQPRRGQQRFGEFFGSRRIR